jgi:hypothetical protein
MTDPYAIIMQDSPSIGHEIGLLSAQLTVIFFDIIIFVGIIMLMLSCCGFNKSSGRSALTDTSTKLV